MKRNYDSHVLRGLSWNLVGLIAKLLNPILFVLINRSFGSSTFGIFVLAFSLLEFLSNIAVSGYSDAIVVFASPHLEEKNTEELYQSISNSLLWSLCLGGIVTLCLWVISPIFVGRIYPQRVGLTDALQVMGLSVPFHACSKICVSALKAKLEMRWEALLHGFARPAIALALLPIVSTNKLGLVGLAWVIVISHIAVATAASIAYGRSFSWTKTTRAIFHFKFDRSMFAFAWPQNLNMTLNRYLSRIDIIMLGAYNIANWQIGLYGTAALITSNLREVRLAFSDALSPVVSRLHQKKDYEQIEFLLEKTCRWIMLLLSPLIICVILLRNDLLAIFSTDYIGKNYFVLVLLGAPYINCALGLAGNAIVFTRHSRWNLLNSAIVVVANTLLNLFLIPRLGLLGAAIATVAASFLVGVAAVAELRLLENIHLRWQQAYKSIFALLVVIFAGYFTIGDIGENTLGWLKGAAYSIFGITIYIALLIFFRCKELIVARTRLFALLTQTKRKER